MIPLLDADTLILLSQSDRKLRSLTSSEVLDLVVSECHCPGYCDAHQFIQTSGLSVINTNTNLMPEASYSRSPSLSFHDLLNLSYASSDRRTIVTNSKCLISICIDKGIEIISYQHFLEKFALN